MQNKVIISLNHDKLVHHHHGMGWDGMLRPNNRLNMKFGIEIVVEIDLFLEILDPH